MRGGKRPNSGRKKKEPTITISFRVPEAISSEIKMQCANIIAEIKNKK
jgi:hypothetical protein